MALTFACDPIVGAVAHRSSSGVAHRVSQYVKRCGRNRREQASEAQSSSWPSAGPPHVVIVGGGLVVQLRAYLRHTGYRHGPLFRADKNGRGGPLRNQSAHEHWVRYCAAAGVDATLHHFAIPTRRSSSTLA
jgi:hypothetical protein